MNLVSVVIPAYNEEDYIHLPLESLMKQKTDIPFEVIVVDNASTDRTSVVAKTFQKKLNLRIIVEPFKGRAAARHTGFREAKGDIILSTDADTAVPDDWVERLVKLLQSSRAVAVTGAGYATDGSQAANAMIRLGQPLCMHIYRFIFGQYWLTGFNFGILSDVYRQSGGFARSVDSFEDIDLGFRVSKLGKIAYFSEPRVIFSSRRFRKGIVAGFLEYMAASIRYFIFRRPTVILSDIR
jgi:glycosyltransferase involved in cell wall biosynthesis